MHASGLKVSFTDYLLALLNDKVNHLIYMLADEKSRGKHPDLLTDQLIDQSKVKVDDGKDQLKVFDSGKDFEAMRKQFFK